MKTIEVTEFSTNYTTYQVEVADDFDASNREAVEALSLYEYPEIDCEVGDTMIISSNDESRVVPDLRTTKFI